MIPYEVIVTAVSERADLFASTMRSMLVYVDRVPERIIVHEDVKKGTKPGKIADWLACNLVPAVKSTLIVTDPAEGLGPAMHRVLHEAKTPIVFYTQEDFDFVRDVPIQKALAVMQEYNLNHIRFNKRKTMPNKHQGTSNQWDKIEKQFGDLTLTISDHWYFQASLWRVEPVLPALDWLVQQPNPGVKSTDKVNEWMDRKYGGSRRCRNQENRHQKLKTYIWGPIAEPAFIKHTGSQRRSEKW